METIDLTWWMGISVIAFPILLFGLFGCLLLLGGRLSESLVSVLTQSAVAFSMLATLGMLATMLATGKRFIDVDLGDWVVIPEQAFHFHIKFIFDRLSIPFLLLSLVLCGVIGAFTRRYLHREKGYLRFFLLYSLFLAGMVVSSIAGTIETLFFGWELVGLSSALLVAYFHERENPVQNGLRVWSVYRLADAAFLIAALYMHHLTGHGDFASFVGVEPWPEGQSNISAGNALLVGLLMLLAASGKSALIPFSGWLPRAMEGPTPSSAVFYGALSVHLGAYLLLRISPIIEQSVALQVCVVISGLASAWLAGIMSRVQTDVKSALAYASLTQVGLIVAEIGFGWYYLALIHIVGHACLRTLQLLRAPTLLTDYAAVENAMGASIVSSRPTWYSGLPKSVQIFLYRLGLERGYLDSALDRIVLEPITAALRWSDRQERRWTDWLSREQSRESDFVERHPEAMAEDARQHST